MNAEWSLFEFRRLPVRGAARSGAAQTRDHERLAIPDQRGGVSRRSASGMTTAGNALRRRP